MKLKFKIAAHLFILFAATTTHAVVKESNSMKESLSDVREGDLVVFDIDNTLIEPVQTLGTDQWYDYLVRKYKSSGLDENQAINKAIEEWTAAQKQTRVRPVESNTPSVIQTLLKRKIPVLALTARPTSLKNTSMIQLKSVGISIPESNLSLPPGSDVQTLNGIIFVGPKNNKGVVLAQILKLNGINPQRLIFVDDKEKHVRNMDAALAHFSFENINYRYGAADAHVHSFNPEIADIQQAHFKSTNTILSDEAALMKLRSLNCKDSHYGADHQLNVTPDSGDTFRVTFITDLDVPGGHYGREIYGAHGVITVSKVSLQLYQPENPEEIISVIEGTRQHVKAFGIEMDCY